MTIVKNFKKLAASVALASLVAIPGITFAQTVTSGLGVGITTPASVSAGASSAVLATINLSSTGTSGDVARVASIPVVITYGGGANASSLENCRIINNIGTSLTTGNNMLVGLLNGTNIFVLDTPLSVSNGASAALTLNCSVRADVVPGGNVTISVAPSAFVANSVTTGSGGIITPTTGTTTSGTAASTSGTVTFVGGTGNVGGVGGNTDPGTTPGLPNTGFGADQATTMLLVGSFVALLATGTVLRKKYAVAR
jgi:hypothetical protein